MTVPPYAVAYVVTVTVAWSADHFNRLARDYRGKMCSNLLMDRLSSRGLHSAIFSFIGAMGFLASAVLPADAYLVSALYPPYGAFSQTSLKLTFQHRYGCLIVAASGAFACIPPLLGWLSSNLRSTAGAGLAIALNVSFGAPGQIVGVWIYKANEAKKGYPTGHWTNAALLLFVAAGCVALRFYYGRKNSRGFGDGTGKKFAY